MSSIHNTRIITDVEETEISKEMFENKRSYEYFLKAFNALKKLQHLKNKGYLILINNTLENDDFVYRIDFDNCYPNIGTASKVNDYRCLSSYVGSTYGLKENTIFVYKKELDFLNDVKYINPSDIKKLEV